MSRFNNGIIQTNDNCIGCNKCIYECVVPGANVSISNSKARVFVDDRKCIYCGKCIGNCVNLARTYTDDADLLFQSLENGEKISLLIEPSFFAHYGKQAFNILGYLKSIGVQKIYSTSFGAEISLWAHVKYLKEHSKLPDDKKQFIANTCPAVVDYISRYQSNLLKKIIGVHSPLMCTAIYVNKYLNDGNKLVYLSPCLSSKIEIQSKTTNNLVSLNVTFNKLMKKLEDVDTSDYYSDADLRSTGFGNYMSSEGGMRECISYFFPRNEVLKSYLGLSDSTMKMLSLSVGVDFTGTQPLFAEIKSCINGCCVGPGIDRKNFNMARIYQEYQEIHRDSFDNSIFTEDYQLNYEKLCNQFKILNPEDFNRKFDLLYRQPMIIPQETYEEIFTAMLKDTPQKRRINCQMCGYRTCVDMAAAIACGYNKKENCIHYMNDEIRRMYYYDTLTGLPNGTCFIKEVEQNLEEARNKNPDDKYVICIGDINKLKVIDDLYGNEAGDKVLEKVAATLTKIFDDKTIIARLSAGQFGLCFKYNIENMNILHSIKNFDCSEYGLIFPVTMRFGIYVTTGKTESVPAMINFATISMDSSVSMLKNTYTVFSSQLRDKMKLEIAITSQMSPALENNEFTLYFQPQYNVATGKLCGAETLCRWVKPGGAIISPELFIPIAEKNGFIKLLDSKIWEMAFKSLRTWLDKGIKVVPISVNISRVSLASDSFIGIIERLVKKYEIPKNLVHFEITESAYMDDKDNIIRRIEKLQNMGFLIAMDDFGSGYSTLNSLKDIPIDILKLDMGFLKQHSNLDKGGKIISNVIHMAQALQFITIAEGVETNEQAEFLKSLGCDIIQGFLYARPMPEQNFVNMLSNQQIELMPEKIIENRVLDVGSLYDLSSSENFMFQNYTGPAMICEYSEDTGMFKLLRINDRGVKFFGVEQTGFSEIRDYINNVDISKTSDDIKQAINKCISTGKETFAYTESKNIRTNRFLWIKCTFNLINSIDNKHTIFTLMEDCTEKKLVETAFSINNDIMSSILGQGDIATVEAFVSTDTEHPFEDFEIAVMDVNNVFLEKLGYDRMSVLNWNKTDILSIINPDDLRNFINKCMNTLKADEGKTANFNVSIKHLITAECDSEGYYETTMILTSKKIREGGYIILLNCLLNKTQV